MNMQASSTPENEGLIYSFYTLSKEGSATINPPQNNDLAVALNNTRFVVQKLLIPLVVAFGVVGNLLNIAVLTRKRMRSSTSTYLTALAVCDTLYLMCAFTLSFNHYAVIVQTTYYKAYHDLIGRRLTNVASNASVSVIVTFTIERFCAIRYPLRTKMWSTPRRALIISLVVGAAAVVLTVPDFFEQYVVVKTDSNSSATVVQVLNTNLSQTHSYNLGYRYLIQVLFTFIPVLLLLIFNALLIQHVLKARRERILLLDGYAKQQQQEQTSITVTLIAVVVVFLCCQLPQALIYLYTAHLTASQEPPPEDLIHIIKIVNNVVNLLVMINAACNFVLYSCFSNKFRATCSELFCHKLRRRKPSNMLTTNILPSRSNSLPAFKAMEVRI